MEDEVEEKTRGRILGMSGFEFLHRAFFAYGGLDCKRDEEACMYIPFTSNSDQPIIDDDCAPEKKTLSSKCTFQTI